MGTTETQPIDDILKLQSEAFKQIQEKMEQSIALLDQERKEWRTAREIQEDMIKEYDRLTQRLSLQIRALIEVVTRVENLK